MNRAMIRHCPKLWGEACSQAAMLIAQSDPGSQNMFFLNVKA